MEPEFLEYYEKNKQHFVGVPLDQVYKTWLLAQQKIGEVKYNTNKQLLNG